MFDLFAPPERKAPRQHQQRSLDLLRQSLAGGNTRPCLQAPTGAGKTYIAAMIISGALSKGNRVVFTVPVLSLINQTVEAFEAEGVRHIGVIQADHPRTDFTAPVQVASVQTLARRERPQCEVVVVDECHIGSKVIAEWMAECPNVKFIGLSATPWRKGMAKEYDDLIIGATVRELIGAGYLSDFRVFAPAHPDLTGVKTTAGDFNQGQLGEVMGEGQMVADVVSTWLEKGEARPTLCFAVDRAHAKKLQADFERAGVPTGYVDAYTDEIERALVQRRFERGEIKVVCNVGCLTTGIDWDVRCIILARPTKSEMLYVQMIGRGLRTADGKDDCLILDHADNTLRLGFVTDIHHTRLKDGKREERNAREQSEPLPKECTACGYVKPAKVAKCPSCGFKPERQSDVEFGDGELVEVKGGKRKFTKAEKQKWWSGLLWIARDRSYAPGWAAHKYREKFKVWPRGLDDIPARPALEVTNWVKSRQIAWAKKQRAANA